MPPKAAGSRPAGTNAPLAAAPSTLQIPNAPVDAMPPSAGNGVVPWRPAPPARPGTTPALMTLFTVFTKALTPATLPDVDETAQLRSEEHTSELQSLMRISYAVFCLKKKNKTQHKPQKNAVRNK